MQIINSILIGVTELWENKRLHNNASFLKTYESWQLQKVREVPDNFYDEVTWNNP